MDSEFWPDHEYKTVGKLILEDGTEFVGYSVGYEGHACEKKPQCNESEDITEIYGKNINDDRLFKGSKIENDDYIVTGEVIFNTAMVGYPEALSDPSYFGQILVLTFPSIGNYGVEKPKHNKFGIASNFESNKIHVQGLVICEYSKQSYHYNAYITLSEWLKQYKIPCIGGIDTRALTKILREKGSMLGKIVVYKNRNNINNIYKEINLFDPGQIDVTKYVCNHYVRVFKLRGIEFINNEERNNINKNSNYLYKDNYTECDSYPNLENVGSSFEKSYYNKNLNYHSLLRGKMNLLESSEENIKDYSNYLNFNDNNSENNPFRNLYGICDYDKYLIDIIENKDYHEDNLDQYGYYNIDGPKKKCCEQKEIDKEINMNNDNSGYIQKTMDNQTFLDLVNKRTNDKEKIIVIVDCGIKNSIIKNLMKHGNDLPLTYVVVPYYYDFNYIDYDAVLLSNGPGNPEKCKLLIDNLKTSLQKNKLIFGICLGNQLLGISLGCETYKMRYGNRGVNQPVIELLNNRCYITSQNHGYCLKKKCILKRNDLAISYINANDKSIEGISHKNGRFYTVQFHPEGNNGPEDTGFLFRNFILDVFHKKREYRENLPQTIIHIKKKVLLLGSGGLCIGQAGEFDYSGTQAIKSLKECGIYVILVNPNIATVQTSKGLADKVYFLPVNCEFVEKIIKKEKPDFILCTFGGQTALNCALMLEQKKVLKKNNCLALGTSLESILITENRSMFAEKLKEINEIIAPYGSAKNVEEAIEVANQIGYPILVRTTFSLGGLNSSFINNEEELIEKCKEIFLQTDNEIFIDKSLKGWKEIEYELLRDNKNNCIAICNMENIDPLGIHTGDSIVVAPSQTLSNYEYYKFREIALKVITHLNIIGECNIQFGINPKTGEYCIIEVNARLSRSSALASKATGYPLAYISAKIALGYDLVSLKNSITRKTTACFEPSLDYITTKIPRWDLNKFEFASNTMNSSMKSVGEVMSIGRTFEESIQKSLRCIDDNYLGFSNTYCIDWNEEKIIDELKNPSPKRIDAIHQAFHLNISIDVIHELTNIDYWFLYKFYNIYNLENKLKSLTLEQLSFHDLKYYKKHGFSDKQIAHYLSYNVKTKESDVMKYREHIGLHPHIKVIDTLSAEFPALTNYLYLTYQGTEHDVLPLNMKVKKIKDHRLMGREYNEIRGDTTQHCHNNKIVYNEFSFNKEISQQDGVNGLRGDMNNAEGEDGIQNNKKHPDYSTIPSCKYMHNHINGRCMGHGHNDMFNLKNFLKNNKREEGFIDNDEKNAMGDNYGNEKKCPFSGHKMIGKMDYHNFAMHHGMKCPMGEKKENCMPNSKCCPYITKNENDNQNDGSNLDEFRSNRSSHSTNDLLYLENCNTSEDEEDNRGHNKLIRIDENRGSINNIANSSYYIRDSVYNNEYKINKMRELINKDNESELIKSDKNFANITNGKCDCIHNDKEKTKKINYNEENECRCPNNSNTRRMASKNNSSLMNSYNDDKSDCFSELSYIQNHKKNDYEYEDLYSRSSDNCYSSHSITMKGDNDSSVLDYEEDELNSELSSINSENDNIFHEKFDGIGFKIINNKRELEKDKKKCFIVLGCGCYRIGSSVEFDWSAIHCVKTIRKLNHKAILINCNPETVSTDYDESDRLYFDEITTEVIKFIHNFEKSQGVIIAFGGQTSNNLVFSLYKNNVNILGSSAKSVDCCENRNKFSHLCDSLKIDQPKWNKFTKLSKAIQFANEVKFPVLVRPSYVLSGAAMRVVNSFEELKNFLMKAAIVSKDNPVVISKFIENAKEIEIDCVSKNGKMINYAISEHVENAGVHSGDATLILPAQNIYVETHRKIKKISEKISKYLNISGPFNIQFICHQNEIKIIECNLRASRTFPFISKALNLNFIDLATRILMGYDVKPMNISLIDLEYTAIKSPIFSFNRLHGSDCILGVEMKSTGEVACFGLNKYEALLKSLVATGMKLPKKSILISIKNLNNKLAFEEPFQLLFLMGFTIYATEGTYEFYSKFLSSFNIDKNSKFHQKLIKVHNKDSENILPNITDLIMNHKVEMVINITDALTTKVASHGYKIRRLASDFQVPIITNMKLTSLFIDSLYRKFCRKKERRSFYTIKSYDEYISLV